MEHPHDTIRAITWHDDRLLLLDQRRLPAQQTYVELDDAAAVASAIRDMVVRGAPAIGIAAAYGVVLAARSALGQAGAGWRQAVEADVQQLAAARPTAVNLFWALDRMRRVIAEVSESDAMHRLSTEARRIHDEDISANRRMGELGAALIETPCSVLTHCNTGSLATGGYGTALGVIRSAYAAGRIRQVFADETRPWLQGARLTAWELVQDGIPVQLLVDSAAPYLMASGQVGWVITGADRVTANGDVANKIGTYAAAVAARHHGVRFMVVAPTSTVDMSLASGSEIPIETRAAEEVLGCAGQRIAAAGAGAWNPVFDVTPAALIDAVVTERGVVRNPGRKGMAALMEQP
jgi:methylthioribose-1-phosphate isomerase